MPTTPGAEARAHDSQARSVAHPRRRGRPGTDGRALHRVRERAAEVTGSDGVEGALDDSECIADCAGRALRRSSESATSDIGTRRPRLSATSCLVDAAACARSLSARSLTFGHDCSGARADLERLRLERERRVVREGRLPTGVRLVSGARCATRVRCRPLGRRSDLRVRRRAGWTRRRRRLDVDLRRRRRRGVRPLRARGAWRSRGRRSTRCGACASSTCATPTGTSSGSVPGRRTKTRRSDAPSGRAEDLAVQHREPTVVGRAPLPPAGGDLGELVARSPALARSPARRVVRRRRARPRSRPTTPVRREWSSTTPTPSERTSEKPAASAHARSRRPASASAPLLRVTSWYSDNQRVSAGISGYHVIAA